MPFELSESHSAVVAQMKQSLSKVETEEGEEAAGEPDWEVEALAGSVAATSTAACGQVAFHPHTVLPVCRRQDEGRELQAPAR